MHLIRRHAAQDNNSCLRRIRAIATYYLPLEKLHRAGRSWLRYRRLWRRTRVSIFILILGCGRGVRCDAALGGGSGGGGRGRPPALPPARPPRGAPPPFFLVL